MGRFVDPEISYTPFEDGKLTEGTGAALSALGLPANATLNQLSIAACSEYGRVDAIFAAANKGNELARWLLDVRAENEWTTSSYHVGGATDGRPIIPDKVGPLRGEKQVVAYLDRSISAIAGAIAVAELHRETSKSEIGKLSDRIERMLDVLEEVPRIVGQELPAIQEALREFASRGETEMDAVDEIRREIEQAMEEVRDAFPVDVNLDGEYLITHMVAYALLGGPNARRTITFLNKVLPGKVPTILRYPSTENGGGQ